VQGLRENVGSGKTTRTLERGLDDRGKRHCAEFFEREEETVEHPRRGRRQNGLRRDDGLAIRRFPTTPVFDCGRKSTIACMGAAPTPATTWTGWPAILTRSGISPPMLK